MTPVDIHKDEVWSIDKDYPNYEVSNLGRIKSIGRYVNAGFGSLRFHNESILREQTSHDGYKHVTLYNHDGAKIFKVHFLVAKHFLKRHSSNLVINHKLGVKADNRWFMLEYVTHKENVIHAYKHGLQKAKKGAANSMAKTVINRSTGKIFPSVRDASEFANISYGAMKLRLSRGNKIYQYV